MSHFGMSYEYAFNEISFQNAMMLSASVPKMSDHEDEEDKTESVDAFGWLKGFNKPDSKKPKNE